MHLLKRSALVAPLVALAFLLIALPSNALGKPAATSFGASLNGYAVVPSINTFGTGSLRLTLNADSIDFTLSYQNLSRPPSMASVGFGQPHTVGGFVWCECGDVTGPACPTTTSGTISGRVVAAGIEAIPAQGIRAGDLTAAMRAVRAGATYATILTPTFPGGEIRGQIAAVASTTEPAD